MERASLNEVTNILENLGRQDEAANRVLKPDELMALFRDRRNLLRHRDALIPCWSDEFEGQIRFICDQYRTAGVDDRLAMKSLVGFGARSALLRFAAHMTTIAMQTKDAVALDLALVALDFSNAMSRDWRDIYGLIRRMVTAAGRCSVDLTDRVNAVVPDWPPKLLQMLGFAKPVEVDSDSDGNLVWRRYEQVLAVTEYCGGPRRGLVNYKGNPHFFDRIFDKSLGAYSDRYRLTQLPHNVYQLFREDRTIWNNWRRSLESGGTPPFGFHPLPRSDWRRTLQAADAPRGLRNICQRIGRDAARAAHPQPADQTRHDEIRRLLNLAGLPLRPCPPVLFNGIRQELYEFGTAAGDTCIVREGWFEAFESRITGESFKVRWDVMK